MSSSKNFQHIFKSWAKSNLNKKSEYFDADTLEAETKKYNEKKYSKK